jgi:hypothetical protein
VPDPTPPPTPPSAAPPPAGPPPQDPVTTRPLAPLILISMFVLMLTVSWSLYNEFFGLRPWRDYQSRFVGAYIPYLQAQQKARVKQEAAFYATPEYQRLKAAVDAATAAVAPTDHQLALDLALIDQQRNAMTPAFQTSRGLVGSLTYQLEQIPDSDKSGKASKLKELNEAKAKTFEVDWPVSATQTEKREMNYAQLNQTFTDLMAAKAAKIAAQGDADQAMKEAQTALATFVKEKLPGLGSADLEGLMTSVSSMDITLRQINVNPTRRVPKQSRRRRPRGSLSVLPRRHGDALSFRRTVTLTKADLGLAKSNDAPYTSHPDPGANLEWHPLEKFGCSPCHGGNGRAVEFCRKRGHGRYEHWLYPLYYPENYECRLSAVPFRGHGHRTRAGPERSANELYRRRAASAATASRASIIKTNSS